MAADAFEDDELAATFFSTVPPAQDLAGEPWQAEPLDPAQRAGMIATFGMLAFGSTCMLAFVLASELLWVEPASVGQARMVPVAALETSTTLVAASAAAHAQVETPGAATDAPASTGEDDATRAVLPPPTDAVEPAAPVEQPAAALALASAAGASNDGAVVAPSGVGMAATASSGDDAPAAAPQAAVQNRASAPAVTAVHSSQSRALPARTAVSRPEPRAAKVATTAGAAKASGTSKAKRASTASGKPPSDAVALRKRAYRALNAGDAHAAQGLAQRSLQLDPSDAGTYIVLGGARDALGDRAGAQAAFRLCVDRASGPLVSGCRSLAR